MLPLDFLAQTSVTNVQKFIDKVARTPLSQVVILVAILSVVRLVLHFTVMKPEPQHYRPASFGFWKFINELCDAIIYAGVFVFLVIRPFVLQTFVIPSGSMVQTLQVGDMIVANKWIYRVSEPQRGDIIVFKPPRIAILDPEMVDSDYIKRCIGIPGDTVEIRDNVLYRNGQAVEEPNKAFTKRDEQYPNAERYVNLTEDELLLRPRIDFKLVEYEGKYWPLNRYNNQVNANGPGFKMVADEFAISDSALMEKLWALPPAKVPPGHLFMMGDNRFGSFDGRAWGLVKREAVVGKSWAIFMPLGRIRTTH